MDSGGPAARNGNSYGEGAPIALGEPRYRDTTLAGCARQAADALANPGGWSNFDGSARVYYQRLLTLVSFMYLADGRSAEQVWRFVEAFVSKVQYVERTGALPAIPESSEPFALPGSGGGGRPNPYQLLDVAPPEAAVRGATATGAGGDGAALSAHGPPQGFEGPPAKRQRVETGIPAAPLEARQPNTEVLTYAAPFGAVSRPHQVLLGMGAVSPRTPAEPPAGPSTVPAAAIGGPHQSVRYRCEHMCW